MNVETVKSLLWVLPVGVGFLWLMRRGGCGGHAGHASSAGEGRHQHGTGHGTGSGGPVDPVCGMAVEPGHVAGTRTVGGQEYSFCSAQCLETFDRDPSAYTRRADAPESRHAHHGCC